MDSLTHIALGACMGEAFAGKKLGKKAMLWGAMAQSAPDIDFVASFWMDIPSALLAHRGFTHSILFCIILTVFLALIAEKWHRPHNISLKKWLLFFGGVIFIHIFIDAFNNYGVAWFEPFTHTRVTFNAIYVADPLFSIWTGLALIALIILKRRSPKRKKIWQWGLGLSAAYLLFCLIIKTIISAEIKDILKKQNIPHTRYFTTPAPLQNLLWFVVAGNDTGYHVGYRSIFDKKEQISFQYFPRKDHLLEPIEDHEELQRLIRFSDQFYTIEQWHDTIVFNDLRFGQIIGWHDPREKFVFHYYLQHKRGNELVVQRGRFAKWDRHSIRSFFRKIKGT